MPRPLPVVLMLAIPWCAVAACGGSQKPEVGTPPSAAAPPTRAPEEPAEPGPDPILTERESSDCPDDMKKVPAGTLWLGSVAGKGEKDEQPQTQMEIDAYCLDETEVSVGQFKACVSNAICDGPPASVQREKPLGKAAQAKADALCTGAKKDGDDLPLNCVGHDDAVRYCKWKGRRLPTEAELEYAAISGEDRVEFPWGDVPPNANVACWQKQDGPCPVRSKPPAAFELYDVVGNLAEWTSTPYGPYPNPPGAGGEMVVRGGSWRSTKAGELRGKRRGRRPILTRDVDVGFRCGKSL